MPTVADTEMPQDPMRPSTCYRSQPSGPECSGRICFNANLIRGCTLAIYRGDFFNSDRTRVDVPIDEVIFRLLFSTTHQCGEVFTNKRKTNPRFEFYAPFGTEWGYRTSAGIISVSNITHHGYIWNDGDWILHAEQPRSEVKKENNKFNFRRKFKEKKEATQNLSFISS